MTKDEFNHKYKQFLEHRHYGCALNNPIAVKFLDWVFKSWTKREDFNFAQIKRKFDNCTIHCVGISQEEIWEVENTINNIYTLGNDG